MVWKPLVALSIMAVVSAVTATAMVNRSVAATATVQRCTKISLTGYGQKSGFAGTEKKVRALAIASWEQQAAERAGARFARWDDSSGQSMSCKRSLLRVTCLAISTPCATLASY
jgi:hypothetical protein